jgi:hypothetical protein
MPLLAPRSRPCPTAQCFEDFGHPKLREHLASVITIMKLSKDYDTDFMEKLNRIHPGWDKTLPLPFKSDEPGL